ncbi:hypothetical protein A2567_00045 [Candidatus Azambacteria bacterium RIFOXYD1_FULL_42_11]|uniref:Uncharacterized protein n=4 Tax=Candidatus Azamiibacteriota TaxID=1752741 RepID=A0A0G1BHC8_9BACT|nr:MAG: hypothetical protein UV07_C0019G0005 [Candidatus Azambacteria bacterium GW2011_GWB1_42_17]KKS45696.1 MAG: hypothetical protein UV10_C0016G0010 [Candidatus Azambacteria bacterium GW2011_GWA1_42_19]KKS74955.1 MAG: hypothetical protein UV48_C0023G0008 [Candidatus Azambacteria bacterium GW2011_GWA2_42_9]KKS88000.1 MAG: hypothetical protein UV62_C0018G0005 [Parcubacteria group bacterium GW2011_GWC1_43_11]OGD41957.1 MAG: hypothetical protein A2567_00045 [Candidatus Azambacteria bacterium RIFO
MGCSDGAGKFSITTVMEESIEPFWVGNSLVFTIAANGKTWPKRLDSKISKSDIELQIYSPVSSGCLIQRWQKDERNLTNYQLLPEVWNDLTVEQRKKISAILAQKGRINYLLGTLMVSFPLQLDEKYGKREPDFMKVKVGPENFGHLDGKKGNSYIVRVIDCSYRGSPNCTCHGFVNNIRYDDVNFSFVAPITSSGTKDVCEIIREKQKQSMQEVMSASFPHTLVKAFPANHKSFDISGMKRVSDRLVVMYGENNIFDVFSIDDALLILEEDRISETTSIQAWTLCIAQNQVARNLLRLYSNNPSLSAV